MEHIESVGVHGETARDHNLDLGVDGFLAINVIFEA
jgi:hypothetical protein